MTKATASLKEFVKIHGRQPTPFERLINGYPLRAEEQPKEKDEAPIRAD